jgi:hypothetical protein
MGPVMTSSTPGVDGCMGIRVLGGAVDLWGETSSSW